MPHQAIYYFDNNATTQIAPEVLEVVDESAAHLTTKIMESLSTT